MRELARLMPDRQIARLLNRIGVATGYGNACVGRHLEVRNRRVAFGKAI